LCLLVAKEDDAVRIAGVVSRPKPLLEVASLRVAATCDPTSCARAFVIAEMTALRDRAPMGFALSGQLEAGLSSL